MRKLPVYPDLRAFLNWLGVNNDIVSIDEKVSVRHEMTAIQLACLHKNGPALRFNNPTDGGSDIPVISNLFGTRERVAAGLGLRIDEIHDFGKFLSSLRAPQPIEGWKDALSRWPTLQAALQSRPKIIKHAPVQDCMISNLNQLPIQTPWPGDSGPLITWPVVITHKYGSDYSQLSSYNLGVYRSQILDADRLIMRWLAHRGGAAHALTWRQARKPMPVAIALGADPAFLLSSALPLPENISEIGFSGVLRGARAELVPAISIPLMVPAHAEIMIEGWIHPDETAPEGPFGDHTGYYNSVENFPVLRVSAITSRKHPLYLSTVTGRPPDEPSVIGEVFNDLSLPLIQSQIPEVEDLWLPSAACSYRIAVVSIRKRYAGQARRVMMALWGMLTQFSYTKIIIVVDNDIDIRNWSDIAWVLSTRFDPVRDIVTIDRTPMDYLDFSSPEEGLSGKIGLDATNKIGTETRREWGRVMKLEKSHMERAEIISNQIFSGYFK